MSEPAFRLLTVALLVVTVAILLLRSTSRYEVRSIDRDSYLFDTRSGLLHRVQPAQNDTLNVWIELDPVRHEVNAVRKQRVKADVEWRRD
jgi:hypothetical protein